MLGQTLDRRYRITHRLGQGGFGQTFLAEDMHRPGYPVCVVKHLHPASDDPEFLGVARRLFHSEAESLEKLGKHPQIPQLLAFFEENQEFYLVQEWIEGHTLVTELPLGQRWSEAQVITLLREVLNILAYIHRQGVIHRDIKPDNVIRRASDRKLVLVDFGSVKQISNQTLVNNSQLSGTVAVGTPGYMAAEQSQGKPRPSSDIYALGVTAIQALTGMVPAQLREDADGEIVWRDQADVSPALAHVLTGMIRHYFKLRYQTAEQVLQALDQLSSASQAPVPRRPPQSNVGQSMQVKSQLPTRVVIEQTAPAASRQLQPPPVDEYRSSPLPLLIGAGLLGFAIAGFLVALNPQLVASIPFLAPLVTTDTGPERLAQAQDIAEQTGDLGRALDIAQAITQTSRVYPQAQTEIATWQRQWQAQQALYRRIQAAQRAQRWYEVRNLISQLPSTPYWKPQISNIAAQAERKIADLQRPKPRPKPVVSPTPTPSIEPNPTANPDIPSPDPEELEPLPSIDPSPSSSPVPKRPVPAPSNPSPSPSKSPEAPPEIPEPSTLETSSIPFAD